MKQIFVFIVSVIVVLGSGVAYSAHAEGQLAIQVAQKTWRIDDSTATKGITLGSDDGALKLAVPAGAVLPGTSIELTAFASEYFLKINGDRRITPLYRVVVQVPKDSPSSKELSLGANLSALVRYPGEEWGRKIVRVWGEDDVWKEIKGRNNAEKSFISIGIGSGTTYFSVFASDKVLETGMASWYKYKNCNCAASPDYPKGTLLKVTNLKNGKSVKVKVNDYGPDRLKHPDRVIDLDRSAFVQIAGAKQGVVKVRVEPL